MSEEGGPVPDVALYRSMRKPCQKTSRTSRKKDYTPKVSMPKLKVHCLLAAEDNPTTSQDHHLKALEVIGRCMCRKGDEA